MVYYAFYIRFWTLINLEAFQNSLEKGQKTVTCISRDHLMIISQLMDWTPETGTHKPNC